MLKKWLKQYYSKDKVYTHLLLNGGKYNIPKEKEREFIKIYSECLAKNKNVFVVECRPEVFKFMMDLDIKDKEEWSKTKIKDLVKTIQSVVYQFYEVDINVICCTAPIKIIEDGSIKKIGIHLIWPRHFLVSSDALIIRNAILQKLIEVYGKRETPNNPWEDVVDERVFTSVGLRMVGSDKLTKSRKKENRVYWPLFVMDSKGEMRDMYYNRISNNYEALIIDTSIRMVPVSIGIPFNKIPKWVVIDEQLSEKIEKTKRSSSVKTSCIDIGSKEFSELGKFMHDKLPPVYKNQNIKSIQRYPDGNLLIITDSVYCLNINRDHKSCGIYFFATKKGVYQKCLCPCNTLNGRIFGYCKDYTSSCFEFNKELGELLFPKKNNNKKNNNTTNNLNLSKTQSNKKLCKHLSTFCDNLFDSIK